MSDDDSLSVGQEDKIEKIELFPSNKHKFDTYNKCLKNIFEKMKRTLSKKNPNYNELSEFLSTYTSLLEQDRGKELNADKYFTYMKMSLEGDSNKIAEIFLENIQILIDEELFIGDLQINIKGSSKECNIFHENKVIYELINTITKFAELNDKNILLGSINLIHSILIHSKTGIHSEGLKHILHFYSYVYRTGINNNLTNLAYSYITEMVRELFKKMEHYNLKKEEDKDSNNVIFNNESLFDEDLSDNTSVSSKKKNMKLNKTNNKDEKIILSNNASNSNISQPYFNNDFSMLYKMILERMISKELKYLVDCICINSPSNNNITNVDNLFLVPRSSKEIETNEKFSKLKTSYLVNEKNYEAGYFGWCYICRNKANYYDVKNRLPICSMECKKKLQMENNILLKYMKIDISEEDLALLYFNDCQCVFKGLAEMLGNNQNSKSPDYNQKIMKILSFEMINNIIQSHGKFLSNKMPFIKIIKENLIENLIANCLTNDPILFKQSVNLFFQLWTYFRVNLKQEIIVFNDTVFLHILESDTTSYEEKLCILENFQLQAKTPNYFLELYANYDCDRKEKFLVNKIITSLGKISQGKYLKEEHALNYVQENTLRTTALQTLTNLVGTLYTFSQDQASSIYQNNNDSNNDDNFGGDANNSIIGLDNDDEDEDYFIEESINKHSENVTIDILNKEKEIDENLQYKNKITKAIEKFNIKPINGINYLKEINFIHSTSSAKDKNGNSNNENNNDLDQEAKDIALFLKNTNGLKKEFIGEILGDNKEKNLKILKIFTDQFNFKGLSFTEALRNYLSTFHLPGEGQKIDRIIEQFSKKFSFDNPKFFENPDCSYYLAFAIMMLQTDMHNPNVKNKMGFEGFTNILKPIESANCLSNEYLQKIYNEIQEKPLTLKEIDIEKEKMEINKEDKIKLRMLRLTLETHEKLKFGKDKLYSLLCEFEYVSPLMKSIWTILLASFSVILEESCNNNLHSICLNGMSQTIILLSFLKLDFEKDAFIKGLCKVTNLSNREFTDKEILVFHKIFELGMKDTVPYYKGSWRTIFDVIFMLENIFIINNSKKEEKEKYFTEKSLKRSNTIIRNERANHEFLKNFLRSDIYEKIFTITQSFNNESIIDFISSLCSITRERYKEIIIPGFYLADYCTQKLVEVIELNINANRNLNVFNEIWKITSKLLIDLGINGDDHVSMRSIDSLRQLGNKFLEKKIDNNNYSLQVEVIKSFKSLFMDISNINVGNMVKKYKSLEEYKGKKDKDIENKALDNIMKLNEFAANCFINLISNDGKFMNYEGFRIVFEIIDHISKLKSEFIHTASFEFCKSVINEYPRQIRSIIPFIASILLAYTNKYPEEIVRLFSKLKDNIANDHQFLKFLSIISIMINDKRENVKSIILKEISNIIKAKIPTTVQAENYKNKIPNSINQFQIRISNPKFYQNLMEKILMPIGESLASSISSNGLVILMEMISELMTVNKEFLNCSFIQNMNFLKTLCLSKDSTIQGVGVDCLQLFIHDKKYLSFPKYIVNVIANLNEILDKTLQKDLINLNPNEVGMDKNMNKYMPIISKNIIYIGTQTKIIKYINQFLLWFKTNIPFTILRCTLNYLQNSYKVAVEFDLNIELRKIISKKYIDDYKGCISVFIQQQLSIEQYYDLLYYCYNNVNNEKEKQNFKEDFLEMSKYILNIYEKQMNIIQINGFIDDNIDDSLNNDMVKDDEETFKEREKVFGYISSCIDNIVLPSLINMEYYKEKNYSKEINGLLCKIMISNSLQTRKGVQKVLEKALSYYDK